MDKFVVRFYALVEMQVEAENLDDALDRACDLNQTDLSNTEKTILEIYDVVEAEEA